LLQRGLIWTCPVANTRLLAFLVVLAVLHICNLGFVDTIRI